MVHFLSPVFEALDDTSLDPGVVVGFKVEIVVGVCLLSEHKSEDGGALSTRTSKKAILLSDSSSIVN